MQNSRVVWSGDLTNTDLPKSDLTSGYSYYLCFSVTQRTNKLMFNLMDRYSDEQKKIHEIDVYQNHPLLVD